MTAVCLSSRVHSVGLFCMRSNLLETMAVHKFWKMQTTPDVLSLLG